MGRVGRRGDASYWLANRRSFNDRVDAMCRAANRRKDMVDTWWLAEKLKGMGKRDENITVAEVQPNGTILLHISRPHGMGYVEVTIKIVSDNE